MRADGVVGGGEAEGRVDFLPLPEVARGPLGRPQMGSRLWHTWGLDTAKEKNLGQIEGNIFEPYAASRLQTTKTLFRPFKDQPHNMAPVSYTHLTLPTKLEV